MGLYLVLSGLERLLVEFVRRNKEVLLGLTAPQVESVALMIVGVVVLALIGYRTRRTRPRSSRLRRHTWFMAVGTSLSHVFPLGARLNELRSRRGWGM